MPRFVWLVLFCLLSFDLSARNVATDPGVDAQTKRIMDWLEKRGTPIRYGSPNARNTVYACRIDTEVYLRKPWGIEQTWVNDHVVVCPKWFRP